MTAIFTNIAQSVADALRAVAMEIMPLAAAVESAPMMAALRDMAAAFAA